QIITYFPFSVFAFVGSKQCVSWKNSSSLLVALWVSFICSNIQTSHGNIVSQDLSHKPLLPVFTLSV
ncbi:hypothetical protein ACQP3F_32430, partial [Escherichia coli]